MWVARNNVDNILVLFFNKPHRVELNVTFDGSYGGYWTHDHEFYKLIPYYEELNLPKKIQDLDWSDEPLEVTLTILTE